MQIFSMKELCDIGDYKLMESPLVIQVIDFDGLVVVQDEWGNVGYLNNIEHKDTNEVSYSIILIREDGFERDVCLQQFDSFIQMNRGVILEKAKTKTKDLDVNVVKYTIQFALRNYIHRMRNRYNQRTIDKMADLFYYLLVDNKSKLTDLMQQIDPETDDVAELYIAYRIQGSNIDKDLPFFISAIKGMDADVSFILTLMNRLNEDVDRLNDGLKLMMVNDSALIPLHKKMLEFSSFVK